MKTQLTGTLGLLLGAISPLAVALGLGQVTVISPLDAPLEATVALQESERTALSELHVEVADEAAFRSLGLEWTPLAESVNVQIQEQLDGHRLLLSSAQAVVEPWLDLLLKVASPEGQQTHALTLLFDPPDYSAIAQPNARDSVLVARGDTLWGVATRVKPEGVSTQQMMMALRDANPHAFPSGNVNDIRAGQMLSVPRLSQALVAPPVAVPETISESHPVPIDDLQAAGQLTAFSNSEFVVEDSEERGSEESSSEENSDELPERTFNDMAEQLLIGQALMQQTLAEREHAYRQMQQELTVLWEEVALLNQTLAQTPSDTQPGMLEESVPPTMSTSALHATLNTTPHPTNDAAILNSSRRHIERITAYQWPLASIALGLLLGALVWLRKRRERPWEEVPTASALQASVTLTPAPKITPAADETAVETATETAPMRGEPGLKEGSGLTPSEVMSRGKLHAKREWEIEEVAFEPRRRDNSPP